MPSSKTFRLAVILASGLLVHGAAKAHDAAKGPNGGVMLQADDKHLELIADSHALTVYVTDVKHDPIATDGASGRAIVQADGKTATIMLAAVAPNRLVGKSDAALAKGVRVVVTATLKGGSNVQARFVLP